MHKAALESCKDRGTIANGKTPGHGSFGVDDGPNCLSNIPDEVLAAIEDEDRKSSRNAGRGMGAQYRLGNRERREAAIGIEQTPISFGQKIPLRHFYLVTLRHNESLSRGPQIAETQPWTFGKHSRPRYARFGRRIVPRGSLEYFGIVSACAGNTWSQQREVPTEAGLGFRGLTIEAGRDTIPEKQSRHQSQLRDTP